MWQACSKPVERVDVIARTTGSTLHFAIRLTPTKSLK